MRASRQEWDDSIDIIVPGAPGKFAQLRQGTLHPQSEQLVAYEIGLRQELTKAVSVDVTGFVNTYHNLIALHDTGVTIDPTQTPSTIIHETETNGQDAQTYGTEVAANWQVTDGWKLAGSYSLLIANVHDTVPNVAPNAAAVEQSYPRNQFQIHSYLDITRHIQFNTGVYYVENVGSKDVLGIVGPPPGSYWRADLGVTWRPDPNFELSVGVQNAFDRHHLEAPYNGKASADVDRSVYAQATWKF
jgi:iron complex outermembrane receptor protein